MTVIMSSSGIYTVKQSSTGSGVSVYPTAYSHSQTTYNVGDVRYNSSAIGSGYEVYDGTQWLSLGQDTYTVNLTPDVLEIIAWAKKKMADDAKLEELMSRHPGVRAAWEQLEIMKRLCQQEKETHE